MVGRRLPASVEQRRGRCAAAGSRAGRSRAGAPGGSAPAAAPSSLDRGLAEAAISATRTAAQLVRFIRWRSLRGDCSAPLPGALGLPPRGERRRRGQAFEQWPHVARHRPQPRPRRAALARRHGEAHLANGLPWRHLVGLADVAEVRRRASACVPRCRPAHWKMAHEQAHHRQPAPADLAQGIGGASTADRHRHPRRQRAKSTRRSSRPSNSLANSRWPANCAGARTGDGAGCGA